MRGVILDTNFLFLPFQFRINIFDGIEVLIGKFEPIVLSTTIDELKRLSNSKSVKIQRLSLSAMELAKRCRVVKVDVRPGESYDDVLMRVAKENNYIVATNDRALRKKLREAGIATIFLRQRSYLQIEGYV
ncbi:MAG: 30S processome protein Utp24 [Candidatus Bathyarchaeia archaeon]